MDDIIADATALGKKIAAHPRMAAFMAAAKAVSQDKDAQSVLRGYQEQMDKLRQLEMSGQPIEVDDKRKLAECESKVAGNDLLKKLMQSQADFQQLMHSVNEAIDRATGLAQ